MHIAALPTVRPVGLGVGSFFVLLGITVRPQVYLMLLMKINLTVVFTRTERAKVGIGGFAYLHFYIYAKPAALFSIASLIFM